MARHMHPSTVAPQLLPFLLTYLVFIYDSQSCMTGLTSPGVTYPQGDIRIEYGRPLEIYCILNGEYLQEHGPDIIKNITFKRNNEKLPAEMMSVVNKSTIKLYIEKPPLSESMYYCTDETREHTVCFNSVIVGTKPKEVVDFSCVGYNFDNMTCTWTAPQNYVKTNYSLKYHFQGRNSRGYFNCPKIEPGGSVTAVAPMKCFWDISTEPHYRQMQQIYFFTLQAANEFGNMSLKYNFTHFENVIPEPPYNLTIVNKTTESILLSWSVPQSMRTFPPGVTHRVRYQCEFDNKTTWTTANTTWLSNKSSSYAFNLSGLPYAHALYDIRVSSRSARASERDERLWSRFASVTARTVSKLPAAAPRTDTGSFELVNRLKYRDIIIYWQYIADRMKNGENVTYRVRVSGGGDEDSDGYNDDHDDKHHTRTDILPDELTNTYAKFSGLSLRGYSFSLVTANEMGVSRDVSHVHVPSYERRIPEPTVLSKIAFPDSTYELSWLAPLIADDQKERTRIDNYTIFWCNNDRDRPYQCKGYLRWIHVPPRLTSYNVTVGDTDIYQFAISANTRRGSSGMVWASCTVIPMNGGIGKMKNLWIDQLGSTFIHITWKLGCSDHVAGIEGFKIFYCPITSPVELICKEPEKVLTIDDPSASEGNVTSLRPYTTYMLTVSVITKHNSNSLQSERLFNTTLEAVPDEPPRDVRLHNVTNTSVAVSWYPPTGMNGVLRYYEISYRSDGEYAVGRTTKLEPVADAPRQSIVLDRLKSYTLYMITVKACTVVCSAPSEPKIVRTAVSTPGAMRQPSINNPNVTLIQISWMAPDDRGGEINLYELKIKEKTSNENTTRIINTTDLRYSIPNCHEDETYRIYYFSVRAVNVDGSKRYAGPWSPETENYCQAAPKYIYYILMGIFMFVFMAALALYGIKRLWRRCELMRDIEVKLPGNLEQPTCDVDLGHWPSGGVGKQQFSAAAAAESDGHSTPTDPDAVEQLLLDRKQPASGDSSGCSSGQESVISSLASATNLSSGSDSGNEHPKSTAESDNNDGSLRLRKPGYCVLGALPALPDATSGYVPVPKPTEARRQTPAHSPYVIAADTANFGYSSVVPTSTLINIEQSHVAAPSSPVLPPADLYVKTDPPGSEYLLSSYCRLGMPDGKSNVGRQAAPPSSATALLDRPHALLATEPHKGYVPHKHFDSKTLKGD